MPEIPKSLAIEARAELMWGRSTEEVKALLLSKDVSEPDAAALIESVLVERAETIRADGVQKVVYGALFVIAPVAYYGIAQWMGMLFVKLFAGLCVLGVVGIYKITVGLPMITKPRSHTGDLSNLNG